jgi:hypothetical protein
MARKLGESRDIQKGAVIEFYAPVRMPRVSMSGHTVHTSTVKRLRGTVIVVREDNEYILNVGGTLGRAAFCRRESIIRVIHY